MKHSSLPLLIILVVFLGILVFLAWPTSPPNESRSGDPGNQQTESSTLILEGELLAWEDDFLTLAANNTTYHICSTGSLQLGTYIQEPGATLYLEVEQRATGLFARTIIAVSPPPATSAALAILEQMSLEEKVGQMFMGHCPNVAAATEAAAYHLGGYILFAANFEYETADSIRTKIESCQSYVKIPLLIAVDEEGGSVTRVSRYPQYRETPFLSPQQLWREGGLARIQTDAKEKAALLLNLGINTNLAPVADVCTSSSDYMYSRSFGQNATATADYVASVVTELQQAGLAAALKHFPGYGSNGDTHSSIIVDSRPAETFYENDFLPFIAGIEAGVQMILVGHNIVSAFDSTLPASLSPTVCGLLRQELGFSGLIISDDLAMAAITTYASIEEAAVLAVEAGIDILLTSSYPKQIAAVLAALQDGRLHEAQIDKAVTRILLYKIESGLLDPAAFMATATP